MKKIMLFTLLAVCFIITSLYTSLSQVKYKRINTYSIKSNLTKEMILDIENEIKGFKPEDIYDITDKAMQITSNNLSYDYNVSSFNPIFVWNERKVNCSGYATMFYAVNEYLINKYNFKDYKTEVHLCRVYFLGMDLKDMFSFLPGHIYNSVTNRKTKEMIIPDACIYDFFFYGYMKET